jgi:hypothetical protein
VGRNVADSACAVAARPTTRAGGASTSARHAASATSIVRPAVVARSILALPTRSVRLISTGVRRAPGTVEATP